MPNPFVNTVVSTIPENQIDALPLLTILQFTGLGGESGMRFANRTLKYWPPASVLNGAAPALDGIEWQMVTPFLDLSPCQHFAFVLIRTIPAPDNVATPAMGLYAQRKQTDTDAPPAVYAPGVVNDPFAGWQLLNTAAMTFPAKLGATSERYTVLISPDTGVGSSLSMVASAFGPGVRFKISSSTNAPAGGDHSTYSMAIWGTS